MLLEVPGVHFRGAGQKGLLKFLLPPPILHLLRTDVLFIVISGDGLGKLLRHFPAVVVIFLDLHGREV
jgi:hypothetical protein